ncbi:CPBP family intramembrane glutamic endopeptidase [Halohasta salina]|uniref:CPBP family intramembrane glutamic endopeptidase n=1 Tax=Halohasta salina TaxID=2961621 RepID=UPI0020A4A957|nr:CPBP family intramembrane glutamic endopeptidase [Halohasta salina]
MRRLQWLLWNRSERRLRAPWRLAVGLVFFGLVAVASVLGLQLLRVVLGVDGLLNAAGPTVRPLVLNAVVGLLVAAALVVVARLLDRRLMSDYGLGVDREWWVDWAVGLVIGAGAITAAVAVGLAGGWLAVDRVGPAAGSLPAFAALTAVFVVVGFYEELFVRGYLLTNLAEGFRWVDRFGAPVAAALATLLSALLFGGLHATNPSATTASTIVIAAAGVMLALGYLYTGELALSIGIHTTWNAFQGLVYGLPVSGISLPVSIVRTAPRGSTVVSGGPFGPEAGLLGLFGVIVAALGVVGYCRFRYGTIAVRPTISSPTLRAVSGE